MHTQLQIQPATTTQSLAGSVALITGGGRGIGRMLALAYAGAGARVGLLARSAGELAETVAAVEAAGGVASAAVADVSDPRALRRAVSKLRRAVGPADLLVNNAGVIGPIGPLWEVDTGEWWKAMEVNLLGAILCSQMVLPDMVARRRGRIINMASQAGVFRWPLVSGYSVSKAALVKLTENLAQETSRYGIGVFSIHPGLLPMGMTYSGLPDDAVPGTYEHGLSEWITGGFDEGRGADPTAARDLLLRVASGDADALSGRHLSVHDDLDVLLRDIDEVRHRDLYVLRPQPLR